MNNKNTSFLYILFSISLYMALVSSLSAMEEELPRDGKKNKDQIIRMSVKNSKAEHRKPIQTLFVPIEITPGDARKEINTHTVKANLLLEQMEKAIKKGKGIPKIEKLCNESVLEFCQTAQYCLSLYNYETDKHEKKRKLSLAYTLMDDKVRKIQETYTTYTGQDLQPHNYEKYVRGQLKEIKSEK